MKKPVVVIFLIVCFIVSACKTVKNHEAEITNGLIKAKLYLPDTEKGYYMATRFDWSGIIESLEVNGHNYYGQWFDEYSPTIHDAIMGPVEEFAPLNYDETDKGGNFVKIGVGVLNKPEDKKYNSFSLYPIINHGTWKTKKKSDQVRFIHVLKDENYSYEYTKTIQLIQGKPIMVLSHVLKNTGKKTIETNVYNHNFFVIDNQPTGTGFVMSFPVNVTGKGQGIGSIAEIQENKIVFLRDLTKGETIYCSALSGFSNNDPKDLDIKIENHKTGAGVRITGDQPLLKLVLWASSTTLCPETYINIKIEPGQEFTWKFNYEYYNI